MTSFERWKSLERAELAGLYESLTITAIAAKYEVTAGAVSYRLRTWGLNKGWKHSPGPKRSFQPPIDELTSLYRRMSMQKMAKHYGVGEAVIFTRIKQAGLPLISRSERLKGVPKSEQHVKAMREASKPRTGPANPNWKGGKTEEGSRLRSSAANREWKAGVLAKVDHRCQRCKIGNGTRCGCCGHVVRLHVHHVRSFKDYPELRFDPNNGEALCEACHFIEHHGKLGELLETP